MKRPLDRLVPDLVGTKYYSTSGPWFKNNRISAAVYQTDDMVSDMGGDEEGGGGRGRGSRASVRDQERIVERQYRCTATALIRSERAGSSGGDRNPLRLPRREGPSVDAHCAGTHRTSVAFC